MSDGGGGVTAGGDAFAPKREYIRVEAEREAEMTGDGWRVAAASAYGDGRRSVLLWRPMPAAETMGD